MGPPLYFKIPQFFKDLRETRVEQGAARGAGAHITRQNTAGTLNLPELTVRAKGVGKGLMRLARSNSSCWLLARPQMPYRSQTNNQYAFYYIGSAMRHERPLTLRPWLMTAIARPLTSQHTAPCRTWGTVKRGKALARQLYTEKHFVCRVKLSARAVSPTHGAPSRGLHQRRLPSYLPRHTRGPIRWQALVSCCTMRTLHPLI